MSEANPKGESHGRLLLLQKRLSLQLYGLLQRNKLASRNSSELKSGVAPYQLQLL